MTPNDAKLALDRVSHRTKVDVFENAFRKIKEVQYCLVVLGIGLGCREKRFDGPSMLRDIHLLTPVGGIFWEGRLAGEDLRPWVSITAS